MDAHPLKSLLQTHFISDKSVVLNLPFILTALKPAIFSVSHHTKWTTRLNSLLRSKDSGTRWAGLCLALSTARISREILLDFSQSWIGIALPMVSRSERLPVWEAAIRLLAFIFSATMGVPEFQRQVVAPNVPKFSIALVTLAQKQEELNLKVLIMDTLSALMPLHPTMHRALQPSISALALTELAGSYPSTTPARLVESATKLRACLHTTAGKVGSANAWRKNIDEAIISCSSSLAALRITYTRCGPNSLPGDLPQDPVVSVPLNFDRLRCGVALICALLRSDTSRPVVVPINSLVSLCLNFLTDPLEDHRSLENVHWDSRFIEDAVASDVLALGCALTIQLAECIRRRLTPHFSKIMTLIAYHLEHHQSIHQRLPFMTLITSLYNSCHPHNSMLAGRLIKTILPIYSVFLHRDVDMHSTADAGPVSSGRKGKKRARGYEGDEIFKVGKDVLCSTSEEGEAMLAGLDAISCLARTPDLSNYLQSITSRVMLSLLAMLPRIPPPSISVDLSLRDRLLIKIKGICAEHAAGQSLINSSSLPLVVEPATDSSDFIGQSLEEATRNSRFIDLLLHPRLPPVIVSLPPLSSIALLQSSESAEERIAMEAMGLTAMEVGVPSTAPQLMPPNNIHDHPLGIETPARVHDGRSETVHNRTRPAAQLHGTMSPVPLPHPIQSTPQSTAVTGYPNDDTTLQSNLPTIRESSGIVHEVTIPPPKTPLATVTEPSTSMPISNDDDDEEMPAINMESDSDEG